MTYIAPRKMYKCEKDSIWVDTIAHLNEGDSFDAPFEKRESIYRAAKRLGTVVAGRQLGRKDTITFYVVSKR
jgi:hypothetical protein